MGCQGKMEVFYSTPFLMFFTMVFFSQGRVASKPENFRLRKRIRGRALHCRMECHSRNSLDWGLSPFASEMRNWREKLPGVRWENGHFPFVWRLLLCEKLVRRLARIRISQSMRGPMMASTRHRRWRRCGVQTRQTSWGELRTLRACRGRPSIRGICCAR